MNRHVQLLIIGAGPAGLAAAITARSYGLETLVVDEQPTPGGQIWRNVEAMSSTRIGRILGSSYAEGLGVVRAFRSSGAEFLPSTQVWHLETGRLVFITTAGKASCITADHMILATGAQERPAPFPGWTLPGVMTVGAAQIAMKTSGAVPKGPVWIAGCGPLPMLYATQLLAAGGQIAGFLDTTSRGSWRGALPELGRAFAGAPADMLKGIGWTAALARRVRILRHVTELEALGHERLERLVITTADGRTRTVAADLLLTHEGVVPTIHPTETLGCNHIWSARQSCLTPALDAFGESSEPEVYVAGDGAGIAGAKAALVRGEIAALRIIERAGRISPVERDARAVGPRHRLAKALAARPALDKLYAPRPALFRPRPDTLVCRCEEVTAGQILEAASGADVNRVKAMTRAGMGPCQGRQCGYTVAELLGAGHNPQSVGYYRMRPPLKPLTLGQLAELDTGQCR